MDRMDRELFQFYKMSASGNDFIMIDNREKVVDQLFPDVRGFVAKVCRQRLSVGADGLILIEKSSTVDFSWRFFNADGSEADMCGNGGRCAARFAFVNGIAGKRMAFETLAGVMKAEILGTQVKLQLTTPTDVKLDYPVVLEHRELFVSSVNTGVPHVIILTDNVDHAPVEELGRVLRHHKEYSPHGTNVDFVTVIDKKNVKLRTYERGVEGETLACGTGAVAASVILKHKGLTGERVNLLTRGGEVLRVTIGDEVYLEGDARIIYTGKLTQEAVDSHGVGNLPSEHGE
jgi:diaminopimelate epimerase